MLKSYKRLFSSVMACVMTLGTMAGSFTATASAAVRKVDVWDFGAVAQDGDMYSNHITADQLDNLSFVADGGKFNVGVANTAIDCDFGNDLVVAALTNDRLFYTGGAGTKNYGTLPAHGSMAYSDGYTAGGEYYCNGTGGEARRYIQIANCKAGDAITVYTNTSNGMATTLNFDLMNGTDADTAAAHQSTALDGATIGNFIATVDGTYKVWVDAAQGKPITNRVVRYPGVTVNGKVDTASTGVTGYGLKLQNKTTGAETEVAVNADGTFSQVLAPGYTYTAVMTNATGFGFTNTTKTITVDTADCATGEVNNVSLVVEPKSTYKASGEITGFETGYDLSKLTLTLTPPAESLADTVEVTLDGTKFSGVLLEPDVEYTATLGGVNDYEITSGGTFNSTVDVAQDIVVAPKATYTVTGKLEGASSNAVTSLIFSNVDDDYSYQALVKGESYTVILRDGSYAATVVAEGYKTSSHVVVNGADTTKNLLLVSTDTTVKPVDKVSDVYVGYSSSSPNYDTVGEALTAISGMGITSEADRVTVHIAPGTYREQLTITSPYITFTNDGAGEVVLTWYYGIGYKYYSVDTTGYYNSENAYDLYDKNNASKWGCATYIKEAAKGFKAEGITFETSFNKYVTDEEIADGVELAPPADSSITVVRRLSTDVTSKKATERSTALAIEADDVEFKDCSFIGSQDTLYTGSKDYNEYFKDCYIEGSTDYIFGDGNVVFDNCVLEWCGYSDSTTGGYITAAKDVATYGYLFRNCTVSPKEGMTVTAGSFGRPWGAGAKVIFQDTKLTRSDLISAEGWSSMSGKLPQDANFKEYNTTYGGTAVDTTSRVVTPSSERPVTDVTPYFGDWTPTYLTTEVGTPEFSVKPSLSSTGDINIPYTGEAITVHYALTDTDDDASQINWYLVDANGNETLAAAGTAADNQSFTPDATATGSYVKVVVIPEYVSGAQGTPESFITESALKEGSEGGVSTDPDRKGKIAVFLAGDSTVKDYSAGAINNSGNTRIEGSWGEFLDEFFNESDVQVFDYAEGGRSSWSFITDSKQLFSKIEEKIQPGDYLFIQFGHNDCSETYTDRYVPLGTPDENGIYPITAPSDPTDLVNVSARGTFKYYLNEYIEMARNKGAIPVLVTPVSRMYFNADGTIYAHHKTSADTTNTYCTAVEQLASETNTMCIDMFNYTKDMYEQAYKDDTTASGTTSTLASRLFATGEKTHHSKMGGFVLATGMAQFIKNSELGIAKYVQLPSSVDGLDNEDKNEFTVSRAGVFTAYDKVNGEYTAVDEYWTGIENAMLTALANETPAENTTLGDVNGDGKITKEDAQLTLDFVKDPSEVTVTDKGIENMRVTNDGLISSYNAACIDKKAEDDTYKFEVEK